MHELDLAAWLLGSPIAHVSAAGTPGDPAIEAVGDVEALVALAVTAGGAPATIDLARSVRYGDDVRTEIVGAHGALLISAIGTGLAARGRQLRPERRAGPERPRPGRRARRPGRLLRPRDRGPPRPRASGSQQRARTPSQQPRRCGAHGSAGQSSSSCSEARTVLWCPPGSCSCTPSSWSASSPGRRSCRWCRRSPSQLHLSQSAAGLLAGATGLAVLAISIPAGMLADRYGARRLTLARGDADVGRARRARDPRLLAAARRALRLRTRLRHRLDRGDRLDHRARAARAPGRGARPPDDDRGHRVHVRPGDLGRGRAGLRRAHAVRRLGRDRDHRRHLPAARAGARRSCTGPRRPRCARPCAARPASPRSSAAWRSS